MSASSSGGLLEEWRDVRDWEGEYQISNTGRVYSVPRTVEWNGTTKRVGGRFLKLLQNPAGYYCVGLCRDGKRHNTFVHRMVAETFLGESYFEGAFCCHNDGNPHNNAVTNLRWGTPSENSKDSIRHGTHYPTSREECPRGHLLLSPNLDQHGLFTGKRRCQACTTASTWAFQRRKRGAPPTGADYDGYADRCYARILAQALATSLTEADIGDIVQCVALPAVKRCPRGHYLLAENRRSDGSCLACGRAHAKRSKLRKRGIDGDLRHISDQYYREVIALIDVCRDPIASHRALLRDAEFSKGASC